MTTAGAATIESAYARAPEYGPDPPELSVTVTVKFDVPVVVGVPFSVPEDERVNPAGNEPAVTAKVYGAVPPAAVSG